MTIVFTLDIVIVFDVVCSRKWFPITSYGFPFNGSFHDSLFSLKETICKVSEFTVV